MFEFLRKSKALDPGSPDQMNNPSTVPGAVGNRTANNMPIYLGGVVIIGFLLVVVAVGVQRAQQQHQSVTAAAPQNVKPASNFASELTAPYQTGQIISPNPGTPPADPEPTSPAENKKDEQKPDINLPPVDTGPAVPVNQWALYQDRFDSYRFAAFEAALKSPTSVQTDMPRSAPAQLGDTRARLLDAHRELEMVGDPNAAYQARLAALQGMGAAEMNPDAAGLMGGQSGQASGLGQFARPNTWKLDSQVELPEPYTVQAGAVIPAIMVSGIVSDLPGQVMAQVSTNVYDSPTGRHLLIPQGTRLVGTYDNQIAYGQSRVLMAWQRLLFPDGRTLDIQAMPGADSAGKAGFKDRVNTHFWRIFGSAVLLSGVVAGVSLSQDDGDSDSDRQRASDALSEALGQNLGSAIAEMLRKSINISPTIEIRPGYRFTVMVTKDMVFSGPYRMEQ